MAIRRKMLAVERRIRAARLIAKALKSRSHPILAQIVPTRRCNLSGSYCNEFDKVAPVATDLMINRVDRLAALGTPERIRRLNRAGLDRLQISVDNMMPDSVSHKSLKVLDRKLRWVPIMRSSM